MNTGKMIMERGIIKSLKKFFCPECKKWYDISSLDKKSLNNAKRTGLCFDCYAKNISRKRENAEMRRKKKENKKLSIFARLKNMIIHAHIDNNQIQELINSRKKLSLTYALLMPVDAKESYHEVAFKNNKARYARCPIIINGQQFYLSNHVYTKNFNKIRDMLVNMHAINNADFPLITNNEVSAY